MSNVGTNSDNTVNIDTLVPHTSDMEPIVWDGNAARIDGLLDELGDYYETNGLFQPYIKGRYKVLSNGKLAVDAI